MDYKKDYYTILGVSEEASPGEIKKAFREKAKEYHPDVNQGDEEAERKFKEVNEAYGILSDQEKRREYESVRNGAFSGGGTAGFSGFDLFDTFGGSGGTFDIGNLFGGTGGNPRAMAGRDIVFPVTLSFEEAVRGVDRRVEYLRSVECGKCKGLKLDASRKKSCQSCGGSGLSGGGGLHFRQPCSQCGGRGQTGPLCPHCGGRGMEERKEKIRVKIPPGADRKSKIRVSGKGEGGLNGGYPGDLYLSIDVEPHPYFRREGKDINLELPLNYSEAVLGGTIDVPTIDGTVSLKIPPGTGGGRIFRLRGKGVPGGDRRGDQYVKVKIVVPPSKNEELRKLVEEIAKWEDRNIREKLK